MGNFDEIKEKVKQKIEDLKHNKKFTIIAAIILIVVVAIFLIFNFTGKKGEDDSAVKVKTEEASYQSQSKLYVDVDGAVKNPGLYEITSESRIYDVIKLAGGLLENADTTSINQAEKVTDGQKIMIPFKSEEGSASSASTSSGEKNGKVNINSADSAALQQIPGIGPSKADKIITYRNTNGKFKSIEDLKNVNGIGDKTFESIKEYITI